MRIWSKKLISILPAKQLKAMRYELGDMIKQYPNIKHPLVKFANNYDIMYLWDYYKDVLREFKKRNINHSCSYDDEIFDKVIYKSKYIFSPSNFYEFKEDDKEYLKICYWNLYEKYLRNVITDEEWQKIEDLIGKEV